MKKICGIYKITCLVTNKIYIGQSVNCNGRKGLYKNGNCKAQVKIYRSIKKYGWETHKFEIICECLKEDLNYFEKYYVDLFKTFNQKNGLNLKDGGGSTATHSEKSKEKMSESHKKRCEDPKERKKKSEAMKKVYENPEARRKTSEAIKKVYEDPEERRKRSEAQKKRFKNPEERRKASDAMKKMYEDPEERRKRSEAGKKAWAKKKELINLKNKQICLFQ